ncbi:MAG: TlpA family protein disulfide reductase [Bacteroidales bacterium]|nr:TlpA family protein disulfide reductase [Bacteroidales bacterium]
MKKRIGILALAAISMVACQKRTTLQIDLTGLPEGAQLEILKCEGSAGNKIIDHSTESGECHFTFNCDSVMADGVYFMVMIADSNRNVCANRYVYIEKNTKACLKGDGIRGNRWEIDSKHPQQIFENRLNACKGEYADMLDDLYYESRSASSREARYQIYDKIGSIDEIVNARRINLLAEMPVDDIWLKHVGRMALSLFYDRDSLKAEQMTTLYNHLNDAEKETKQGKTIYMALYGKGIEIGDKITDYDLYDAEGGIHHLSDYQGRQLLLDFSSYYCGPCRMIKPLLNYMNRASNDKLAIVNITNDNEQQYLDMVKEEKPDYEAFNDHECNSGIFAIYRVACYPTFFVISPDGIVEDKWEGVNTDKLFEVLNPSSECWNTTTVKEENYIAVEHPKHKTSSSTSLGLEKVELYKDSTVVTFSVLFPTDYSINSGTTLHANGKEYKIVSSSIGLDTTVESPFGKDSECKMTFEPLPLTTGKFDFVECEDPSCFNYKDIVIPQE